MSRTRAISLLLIPAIIIAFLPSFFQLRSTSGDSLVADYSVYCIGDSLTHYYWPGQSGTLLGPSYTVVNKGVDGNTTQMMLDRFNADVLAHDADCVVVWGGINDVGRGYDVSLIEDNLQSVYTQAHNAGIKVVAITISPFISQGYLANKKTVNLWIMNTAANVDYRVDVYPLLEDPNTPDAMRPDYTVDGEHLNSAGGAVVAWAVRDALQSNVINDPVGDLVVFSQDYTNMSAVPGNMCVAMDTMSGDTNNLTLRYNGTSHCVSLDATEGAVGKLFVGGLSPSLSTTITLDMGMGRTEESATVYICAGGAWLGIRLRNGAPTDDLEITSYYYNYTNPTLHYATSVSPNVGFSGDGRFKITIVSNTVSKTNTIYLNDVEKLTTPYTSYRGSNLLTVYDPFVNPFIYFDFASISSGQTAYLQLYSIEQTVPEYSYVTPISNPKVIPFGVDGPDVWSADDDGLSLLDRGTIWADVTSIDDYSLSELAALKALIADGFELGIHFSTRLSDLPLADAKTLMNAETADITAIFGEHPTSWCSLQGADNITHAEYVYTNLGMVSRNGVNGSAAGLSSIGNLCDDC